MPLSETFQLSVSDGKQMNYPDIPNDLYTLEIYDINEVDSPKYDNTTKTFDKNVLEKRFKFEFAILEDKTVTFTDENGAIAQQSTRGRRLWKEIRPVLSKAGGKAASPSSLYLLLKTLYEDEANIPQGLTGKDLNDLIGKQLKVMIINKISKNTGKKRPDFSLEALLPVADANKLPSYVTDPLNPKNMPKDDGSNLVSPTPDTTKLPF